jgi:hypothetical protein
VVLRLLDIAPKVTDAETGEDMVVFVADRESRCWHITTRLGLLAGQAEDAVKAAFP